MECKSKSGEISKEIRNKKKDSGNQGWEGLDGNSDRVKAGFLPVQSLPFVISGRDALVIVASFRDTLPMQAFRCDSRTSDAFSELLR